ncbi:MAG TPA: TonB family protein [Terracidiphilus sp.]|nr:TonB family protein [Terracidiphilus sp.]
MSRPPQIADHLEQELTPEPIKGPMTGSLVLHVSLLAAFLVYGVLGGLFRHNTWGGAGLGGATQVNLVSNALPLPTDHPPNQNVLATDTPSEAPTTPTAKTRQAEDETAIPIAGKQKQKERETTQRSVVKQEPVPTNRANYGEQAGSSMPHTSQGVGGPATVSDASFGTMFGWYVSQIQRKMDANSYRSLADPRTPKGAKVYIEFVIYRDGSHSDVKLDRSSGSSTWDSACMRAAQRVDTFGPLPSQYRSSSIPVSYYCEY